MQDKYKFVMKFLNKSSNDHVGAYAAQSAYFWIDRKSTRLNSSH